MDKWASGQLGTRTIKHQTIRHQTIRHQDNWTPRQLGTKTIGHQDNWAPGQLDTRTTGHQDNWTPGQQLGTRTVTGHQDNNWAPGQQLGTKAIRDQNNWAPRQLGTRTIGQLKIAPGLRANKNQPGLQSGRTPEQNQYFL